MEGPSLSPSESKELAELRRRAYGTAAGIGDDPVAQARLEELEEASHVQRAPEDVTESESVPAPSSDGAPATLAPSPVADAPLTPRPRRWLGIITIAAAAALAGGLLTAAGLSAASGIGDRPSSTPSASDSLSPIALGVPFVGRTPAPDPALTAESLYGGADWAQSAGFDLDTLQGYQKVGPITPWTATRWGGLERCVLLGTIDHRIFSHMGCAPAGTTATLGIPATVTSADGSPHEIILLFMTTPAGVEVRAVNP